MHGRLTAFRRTAAVADPRVLLGVEESAGIASPAWEGFRRRGTFLRDELVVVPSGVLRVGGGGGADGQRDVGVGVRGEI